MTKPLAARCKFDHEHQHEKTTYCYLQGGCRCTPCRVAYSAYQREIRRFAGVDVQVPAAGTIRRLQALACLGYSAKAIAERLDGMSGHRVSNLRDGRQTFVRVATATRITAVYDELSMKVPAPASAVTRVKAYAAAKGYRPPLDWDEGEIDDAELPLKDNGRRAA